MPRYHISNIARLTTPRKPLPQLSTRSFHSSLQRQDRTGVTRNETAPQAPKSRITGSQLPVYPLIAIFFTGSLSFYLIVKSRAGQGQSHYVLPERAPPKEQWPRSPQDSK